MFSVAPAPSRTISHQAAKAWWDLLNMVAACCISFNPTGSQMFVCSAAKCFRVGVFFATIVPVVGVAF